MAGQTTDLHRDSKKVDNLMRSLDNLTGSP